MASEAAPEREDAHPRAAEILTDAFFWDPADEAGPFGTETARQAFARLREFKEEREGEPVLTLLAELLEEWEVADADWEATTADAVTAAGREDEFSLLTRDEILFALAFGEFVEDGRIDPEIQRRASLATVRQALPLVLAPWGDRTLARAAHLDRMRHVLGAARPS